MKRGGMLIALTAAWLIAGACGGSTKNTGGSPDGGAGSSSGGFSSSSGGSSGGTGSSSGSSGSSSGGASSSSGGNSGSSSGTSSSGGDGGVVDPTTCAQAAGSGSYMGCDFWPTVTPNLVWSIFDYAVVVSNAGSQTANVSVTGPGNVNQTATVTAASTTTIYLPWVSALKGADADACGSVMGVTASVLAPASAYHLTSDVPVTVYQFNAYEYQGMGGPSGKSWSACPGSTVCAQAGTAIGCYSFSNDASLLLPTTALTGNYRVMAHGGWGTGMLPSFVTITATAASTTVNVKVSSTGQIIAGTGVAATAANGTLTLTMGAGDVAQLVGGNTSTSDPSGSVIQADHPVQVITGLPCVDVPDTTPACDHVEETVFPAEALGKDYVVAQPDGPRANVVGQVVRFYGEFDNTTLTYVPTSVGACPTTLAAGQVVDCGVVSTDFEVRGSAPFGVGLFTQGATVVDPTTMAPNQEGDPDESFVPPVEQFRTRYLFPAPTVYEQGFAVVVVPNGATLVLDGAPVTQPATPITGTSFGVVRIALATTSATHVLEASAPVSLQVMGYGSYTSYQYPGGLNLQHIAPPPM